MGHQKCPNCEILKSQIVLKDAFIRSKEDKIAQLQEALIKSQKDLITVLKDYPKQPTTNGKLFNEYNHNGYNCGSGNAKLDLIDLEGDCNWIHSSQTNPYEDKEYRVFIGSVKPDITKTKLRRILEEQFGRVTHMDLVISKSCAFVTFESFETYDAAIKKGNVYIDGSVYSVQAARTQRRKPRCNEKPFYNL